MYKKLLVFVVILALVLGGCSTPAASPTVEPTSEVAATQAPAEPTTAATQAPTEQPTAAVANPETLTVMAAASLTESFTELGNLFTQNNPSVKVEFNFAGSQALAQQIAQGAPADVFASANDTQMKAAIDSGRINSDAITEFVSNRLVVIVPKDNPAGIQSLADLAKPGLKLDLAAKEVPVGQYALNFLDKAAADPDYGQSYKDAVLANVVSYEDNVKAVLTKVSLDEADAGIVYSTDAASGDPTKITILDIPDSLNVIATYPIAPINDSQLSDTAQAFVNLVLSSDGQAIMVKYGFGAAPAAASSTPVAETTDGPITLTDALGRTVTLDKAPQRIVVTGKGLFMIADAIYAFPEAGQRITAIGNAVQGSTAFVPMIDPNFDQKTMLESDAGAEQIAATNPDLVILKTSAKSTLGDPLDALGIPVVYVDFETADTYKSDMANLGKIFNNPARAQVIADFYQSHVDAVTSAVSANSAQKPEVLLLYYSNKNGTIAFNVAPESWMQTYLVETAGGDPVWKGANLGDGWTVVTLEQIAAWNPDQIYIVAYNTNVDDVVAGLKADPQWQALKAVQNGKLYGFATDIYSWDQPDTRWILGLDWLAAKINPDLFPDYNIDQDAKSFYQTLYGMDTATFQQKIQPTFSGDVN